jgi:hypothetical protein
MASLSVKILLIIILIAIIALGYYLFTLVTNNATIVLATCPKGLCIFDMSTGLKNCTTPTTAANVSIPLTSNTTTGSTSSVALTYAPASQACSPESTCSDPRYPFAVLPNGASGFACPAGVTCRCVKDVRCPYYSTVYFQRDNTGGSLNGYYKQLHTYVDVDGKVTSDPPLNMGAQNPNFQCFINDTQIMLPSGSTSPTGTAPPTTFLMYPSFCISGTFMRVDTIDNSNSSVYGCGNTAPCADPTQIPVVETDIFGNTVVNADGTIFTCKSNSDPNVAFVLRNQGQH